MFSPKKLWPTPLSEARQKNGGSASSPRNGDASGKGKAVAFLEDGRDPLTEKVSKLENEVRTCLIFSSCPLFSWVFCYFLVSVTLVGFWNLNKVWRLDQLCI